MRKGWFNESYRHYLASKGISTNRYFAKKQKHLKIRYEDPLYNRKYPITPGEAKRVVESIPDTKGIKEVRFQNPQDKHQKDAYAQFMRGDKKIAIFSQPVSNFNGKHYFVEKNKKINPNQLKHFMKDKVIPHEVGHFKSLRDCPTDKNIKMAEARAEASRLNADYKDDKVVKQYINNSTFA